MIVHCSKDEIKDHYHSGNAELDEYDLKNIEDEVSWMAYWYYAGDYEGDGSALCRVKGAWHVVGLGHCSCNGPLEGVSFENKGYNTLEEMEEGGSEEFLKENKKLFEIARKNRKEWDDGSDGYILLD